MKRTVTCMVTLLWLLGACDRKDTGVGRSEAEGNTPHNDSVAVAPTPLSTYLPGPAAMASGGRVGTSGTTASGGTSHTGHGDARKADADFEAGTGFKLKGEAEFEEVENGVKVVVDITNAPPGKRGIHIHEKPDCSNIAGKSMGEHYNPTANPHALPPTQPRHLGDLGNIEIAKDGKGKLEATIPNANLRENDPMSLLKRAIVIHEDEDTGVQPSGGSGKPMACAVIKED